MNHRPAVFLALGLLSASLGAQTTTGTWTLYPPQATITQLSIDPPVNADGSSVWPVKATVPIQYDVLNGYGPILFESLKSAQGTGVYPEYSNLIFWPANLTFDQLYNLNAVYSFFRGNCYGGTLRWSIVFADKSFMYIYYGSDSSFWQNCMVAPGSSDPTIDQSGSNMINNAALNGSNPDTRYETSSNPGTYVTYSDALQFATGKTISWVGLVLDGGWYADQKVTLGTVTVNDNTFVPLSGNFTPVCPTAPATIQVSTIGSSGGLTVDESIVANGPDTNGLFRIVGCKYQYNISGKSLGAGQYQVDAIINGAPAQQTGTGTKFALK